MSTRYVRLPDSNITADPVVEPDARIWAPVDVLVSPGEARHLATIATTGYPVVYQTEVTKDLVQVAPNMLERGASMWVLVEEVDGYAQAGARWMHEIAELIRIGSRHTVRFAEIGKMLFDGFAETTTEVNDRRFNQAAADVWAILEGDS